ncbi:hypothetical protein [Hymenobacter jejuensis]|uniref:Capsule assembly Wzi family protein n=1 Tax=Hymenobacter jejuensis TaxID=2502781 RepID=A0A5B8A2A8_9BACT|nr:hypothetical protein [Hymenobacter jejuensis]QDA60813.1 hypothetical protein FHG12_12185 [Hymenobacter jejuensis]
MGQLDNRAFVEPRPGAARQIHYTRDPDYGQQVAKDSVGGVIPKTYPVAEAGDLRLSVYCFTFFKDNEYFNKIADGYTLFGTQINPQLVYYPTPNLRLEGGVFLWKDFGNPRLQQVRPTFRATYTKNRSEFLFGNIRPHLSHGYIEPLFNFERVILRPLEEGLQYRYTGARVGLDVWVDWQRQQYRYSNYQEEIAGGLSGNIRLTSDDSRVTLTLPVQFTATHHGGQIDTIDRPLQTLFNGATGLVARYQPRNSKTAYRINAYVTGYYDKSFAYLLPYKRGAGLYLNATAETRYLDVMLSYWQGNKFIAPLGGDLYQSASRTVANPTYTEANRRILILRLMRDFSLGEAAAITVRVEPVYDFQARSTEFAAGIYLNFRQEWLLGNIGKRVRFAQ